MKIGDRTDDTPLVSRLLRSPALFLTPLLLLTGLTGPACAADSPQRWQVTEPGAWMQWSSPVIADVDGDGSQDVVVGGLSGRLYAYDARGAALPGWAGGVAMTGAVASSPAVADLDGDGKNEVIVGVGALEKPTQRGGLDIVNADGVRRCTLRTPDASQPERTEGTAVFNAPAVGDVTGDGRPDVVFGSFDHVIRVVDAGCRVQGAYDSLDAVWSAPGLYDVDGNGTAEIFVGGDATRDARSGQSQDGGFFRSLTWQPGARDAAGSVNLAQRWVRSSTETFMSAVAIADLDGDGRMEAVTGSGSFYCRFANRCADSAKVWAFHLDDGSDVPGWPRTGSQETTFLSAPAVGDVDGDGRLDVVVGGTTYDRASAGKGPKTGGVDLFYGDPAKPRASFRTTDVEVTGSPLIADIDGAGTPEVLVPAAGAVTALGPDLSVRAVFSTAPSINVKAAPAVGLLGSTWGLVTSGFDGSRNGSVQVIDLPPPTSAPWPMHRRDPLRTGVVPVPLPSSGFSDVPDGSIFSEPVRQAAADGITGGCTATRFCLVNGVTRAQAVTFLWRAAGAPAVDGPGFGDVPADAYYASAVRWAQTRGITGGCSDGSFCPSRTTTRGELVTFLWRAAGQPDEGASSGFEDVPAGAFYERAVTWAVQKKITQGVSPTRFAPGSTVTRGQAVLFLSRSR